MIVTGNTVIDALHQTQRSPFDPGSAGLGGLLESDPRHMVLVTAHRRENFGTPIERICHAVRTVAVRHPDVLFVCPVHLNPTVRAPFFRILAGRENVALLPPLNYRAMVWALHSCSFVVTDSGGLQEEAAGLAQTGAGPAGLDRAPRGRQRRRRKAGRHPDRCGRGRDRGTDQRRAPSIGAWPPARIPTATAGRASGSPRRSRRTARRGCGRTRGRPRSNRPRYLTRPSSRRRSRSRRPPVNPLINDMRGRR